MRLFIETDLAAGAVVPLSAGQAHYLRDVMRCGGGAEVRLFNGRDGEWRAEIGELDRKGGTARVVEQVRPQVTTVGPALLFAPLKKDRVDFLLEKATELGATALQPVITERTVVERVRAERYRAIAIEAAEQCGRLDLPALAAPVPLRRALDTWPAGRRLLWADTAGGAALATLPAAVDDAVLIGPEGGFTAAEHDLLAIHPGAVAVTLGPRILRAETAAVAALALWQGRFGS
jgi:16S rRNA (uracil1498-N3)-methyltransferase